MNTWELLYTLQKLHDQLVPNEDRGLDVPVYVQVTTHDGIVFCFSLKEITFEKGKKLTLEGAQR